LRAEKLVEELIEDRQSGAARLTIKAASLFLKLLETRPKMSMVSKLAKLIAEARPSMPSVANMAYMILRLVEEETSAGVDLEKAIESAVRSAVKDYQRRLKEVIRNGARLLLGYRSVLTHSYSSTVAAILESCEGLKVFVTESRPGLEGLRFAERLAASKVDVTLIVDSAASYVLETGEVDLVLIGCDAILDDCSIVNKIGSKAIALAASETEIPFNVVTDLWKAAIHGFSYEEHPPEEVYDGEVEGIKVLNPYFERVPRDLISRFITEEGSLKPLELRDKLSDLWSYLSGKPLKPLRKPPQRRFIRGGIS